MTKETIKEIFGSSPNMTGKRPNVTREKNNTVIPVLGVDSWQERAISEVRGLRDERGPTQLGIYTGESIKETSGLLKIRRYCSEIAELFQIRPIF